MTVSLTHGPPVVADGVGDIVTVGVIEGVRDILGVTEVVFDGVTDGAAPIDEDGVGVTELLGVIVGVIDGVTELLGVTEGVTVGVTDGVIDGVTDGVVEGIPDDVGVGVAEGHGLHVGSLQSVT